MAMKDRNTLKNYFKGGNMPSEANFENLIDSGINKIDDGFSKTTEDGLMISGIEGSGNLLSFYEKIDEDNQPEWSIYMNREETSERDKNDLQILNDADAEKPLMTFSKKGKIGINTSNPGVELDVNGWLHTKGRAGNYGMSDTIPADGKWHPITGNLNYCQAFEVVARTGIKDTGKHGILHAIAVSAFGRSRSRIRKTRGFYDFWKPVKIQLRWTGKTRSYRLEMRCKQNLGQEVQVKYYITQLWSDEEMGIAKQFRDTDQPAQSL
jgi:hypothetical protein